MKLKGIKPGMAIHCTEIEHMKSLVENGIIGSSMLKLSLPIWITIRENDRGWVPEYSNVIKNTGKSYCKNTGLECIEFYDLIEPELETEEVLQIIRELPYDFIRDFLGCYQDYTREYMLIVTATPKQVIDMCVQWKANHEKKELEVEWVYRVFGAENFGEKFFDTEEEAIKWCEELAKSQKTKKYTRYERGCRVKAEN